MRAYNYTHRSVVVSLLLRVDLEGLMVWWWKGQCHQPWRVAIAGRPGESDGVVVGGPVPPALEGSYSLDL